VEQRRRRRRRRTSGLFMQPVSLLLSSQESVIESHPKPTRSTPRQRKLSLVHFNIMFPSAIKRRLPSSVGVGTTLRTGRLSSRT
jgi:hypothetical protein